MSGDLFVLAASAAGEAMRGLLKTALGTMVLAFVLAGIAFWIAFDGSWPRGVLAAVLVLMEAGVIGAILTAKRAVLSGLAGGLRSQHLGQRAASLLLSPDGPMGRVAGAIPVAEAERRLRLAVDSMLGLAAQREGIRASIARAIQERLLRMIEQVTLARFRADAAEHGGGVDITKVCEEIGNRADELLLGQVRGVANRLTAILVLASTAIAVLVAVALRQWNP